MGRVSSGCAGRRRANPQAVAALPASQITTRSERTSSNGRTTSRSLSASAIAGGRRRVGVRLVNCDSNPSRRLLGVAD